MAHIHFSPGPFALRIHFRCEACNNEQDVTNLVKVLNTVYISNCPDNLFQAFKILRLGSQEHSAGCKEHSILGLAILVAERHKEEAARAG